MAYLSDVKLIPPATLNYLCNQEIDVLILDALFVKVRDVIVCKVWHCSFP